MIVARVVRDSPESEPMAEIVCSAPEYRALMALARKAPRNSILRPALGMLAGVEFHLEDLLRPEGAIWVEETTIERPEP